ncbi:alpha/beta fold hydrolase [Arthrobacter sp. Br18]|uniref:alpha/beta fold hydrolase n=1 Tax=Arthrobacter sp. Br18 TaxID=1312954 RepID=UPI00047D6F8B|nr:alpha/beta fold hydrolase [Arthrobacter sp. Br18]
MVALPGVDPAWSTYLDVPSTAAADNPGTVHSWHYLDNGRQLADAGTAVRGTLLCVHGNPTWSYLWRTLVAQGVTEGWRVVAVDQLDMGFSRRTRTFRRLADRVTDLEDFVAALELEGPVVTVGHDWGGVVSLGFAHRNRFDLAGVVLTNTAIHQDPAVPIPAPLRLALLPGMHRHGTRTTSAFLDVTHALARPKLRRDVHAAFRAPYRTGADRAGIANFVSDIPADPSHPSHAALADIAEGVRTLEVPALMVWGPRDPVFTDTYLEDLTRRLPSADVHRFEDAGHLVQEDADVAGTVFRWLDERLPAGAPGIPADAPSSLPDAVSLESAAARTPPTFLWHQLLERSAGPEQGSIAVAEMGSDGIRRRLSWRELADDVDAVAAGLSRLGLGQGSRVSLLVPPGVDLTVSTYACLRIGAVIVVADAGLGTKGLSRAVKGSVPDAVIGIERALLAARLFGWPARRISVGALPAGTRALLRVESSLEALRTTPPGPLQDPEPDADAAILFTSGSTGPAKGVVYTHRQLSGMRDTVGGTFGLGPGGALVAGFAPFALLGPALGAASVTPDMDVTAPKTLTAQALGAAAQAIDATAVFAAPAALRNIVATRGGLGPSGAEALGLVTMVLSAGAPVPARLLEQVQELLPAATLHTPYGMTEALPVTDIDLEGILRAAADAAHPAGAMPGAGNGVCVGRAVQAASIAVSPLSQGGIPDGAPTTAPGVTGEILVDAPHVKDRYHRLWRTEGASSRTPPWHRTGDVGHFDEAGRLWVEGRLGHLITSPGAVLTPVGVEQALENVDGVRLAAVVGVGPTGTQAVVAVIEADRPNGRVRGRSRKLVLADAALTECARSAARKTGVELAAVLTAPALPVDVRHNAKIDRTKVAEWASAALAGGYRTP